MFKFDRFDVPATRAGKKLLSQTINCKRRLHRRCFWRIGTDLVMMFVQSKNAKGLSWVFKSSQPFNDMEMTWRILESVGNSFQWMKAIKSLPQSGLSQRLPNTKVQPNSFCFGKQRGKQCSVYTGEIVFKVRRQQTKGHVHFLLQSCWLCPSHLLISKIKILITGMEFARVTVRLLTL